MATKLFCTKPRTHTLFLPSLSFFLYPNNPLFPRFKPLSSSAPSIKMSTQQIIEHIVLFKVKPDADPSKIDSMVSNLNGLKAIDQVLHFTAGPLARIRSSPFPFTHILHSRYKSKEDLNTYSAHPTHVSVVSDFVRPVCEDIMAVDWVADNISSPVQLPPASAMRVNLLKLKEGLGESEKSEILGVIGGIKDHFPAIQQISFGENFSPARSKGFSIGSIAVLPGLSELEALDSDSEVVNSQKEKVRGLIESVIVLDYEIPQQQNASL